MKMVPYEIPLQVVRDGRPIDVTVHCEAGGFAVAVGKAVRADTGEVVRLLDLERGAVEMLARARHVKG